MLDTRQTNSNELYNSDKVKITSINEKSASPSLELEIVGVNTASVKGIEAKRIQTLKGTLRADILAAKTINLNQELLDATIACDAASSITRPLVIKRAEKYSLPERLVDQIAANLDQVLERTKYDDLKAIFSVKEVFPGIVAVFCPFRPILCSMFMRPQESYENPFLAGKTFSREECAENYRNNMSNIKEFSYFLDWGGFNFPDEIARKFANEDLHSKSKLEDLFVEILTPYLVKSDPFYVIGFAGDISRIRDRDNFQHEIRHGLFHTNSQYRETVSKLIANDKDIHSVMPVMFRYLDDSGYHPKVWIDELQAYLGGSTTELLKAVEFSPEQVKILPKIRTKIQNLAFSFLKDKELAYNK